MSGVKIVNTLLNVVSIDSVASEYYADSKVPVINIFEVYKLSGAWPSGKVLAIDAHFEVSLSSNSKLKISEICQFLF